MAMESDLVLAEQISAAIDEALACGKVPLVLLDLDLTLFDNRARTRAILSDFLMMTEQDHALRMEGLERLHTLEIVYSIQENMHQIGIHGDAFRSQGLPFWMKAFFSDEYCRFDTPFPGAVEATRRFHQAGANLVYLTGRYAATQALGTVESLRKYGFPVCELGTQIIMKTEQNESDHAYKRRVAEGLKRMGETVASFDNEPGHCNTMKGLFPEAAVVLFGSLHSPKAPPPEEGIHPIQDWSGFIH